MAMHKYMYVYVCLYSGQFHNSLASFIFLFQPVHIFFKYTVQYNNYLFIYLGFYITFNTVQVISRWVVGRVEETST